MTRADSSGRAIQGECLRLLACQYYGFESRRRYGCLSLVSVVASCHVQVSAIGRSLVKRFTTECGASEYYLEILEKEKAEARQGCRTTKNKNDECT